MTMFVFNNPILLGCMKTSLLVFYAMRLKVFFHWKFQTIIYSDGFDRHMKLGFHKNNEGLKYFFVFSIYIA